MTKLKIRKGSGVLATLGAVAIAAVGPALAASYPYVPPDSPGLRLQIHASRYYALSPAEVTVYARLSGVEGSDRRFCHAGETWISGRADAGGPLTSVSRHDPACVHAPGEAHVDTLYTKDFRFTRPGSYTCRLVLTTNDGRLLQSNLITIVVR
jgi:hypothetical protein